MTTAHTPGPWTADPKAVTMVGDCVLSHQIWGKQRIAFVESQNVGLQTAAANARLIAAAPELLAALKDVLEYMPSATAYQRERWRLAGAAIAKAEGQGE